MTATAIDEICFAGARELAAAIRTRKISAREVMLAFLAQINRVNPKINAIVAKLADDHCLALADAADRCLARDEAMGALYGLPFAFKELDPAAGFPMTLGSPIFKDVVSQEDSVLVERLRAAGQLPNEPAKLAGFLVRDGAKMVEIEITEIR
jgi:amidase